MTHLVALLLAGGLVASVGITAVLLATWALLEWREGRQ